MRSVSYRRRKVVVRAAAYVLPARQVESLPCRQSARLLAIRAPRVHDGSDTFLASKPHTSP